MKKAYLVYYQSEIIGGALSMETQLRYIGSTITLGTSVGGSAFLVIPTDGNTTAKSIRLKLSENLHPYSDSVTVVKVDADDVSSMNAEGIENLLKLCRSGLEEQRNFSRFKTRHEGFLAWQLEKPRWVYDDGVVAAIIIDYDEWMWLPIKRDGIYEKFKYDKYLR